MFEQDYIMRLIRQVIRILLLILFHYDIDKEEYEIYKKTAQQKTAETLFDLVDRGQIDEAENLLYDLTDGEDREGLKTALIFYHYLNEKDDNFLEEHDFSRQEVKEGLERVISLYGIEGVASAFWEE